MKSHLIFIGLIYWAGFTISPISAQEVSTNQELYQNLGHACLESIPSFTDSLMIDPPDGLPYLTSHLIQQWQDQDMVLFSYDSTRTYQANFYLSWDMTDASISYTRESRKNFTRTANLSMVYTLIDQNGEFIAHENCQKSRSDTIPKSIVSHIESELFPETQGEIPPDRWVRRHLEPVIIATATALAAFLFFNLRNSSSGS
ncbi:MAG: hypothetical protein OXF08_08420 [Bacteroidetes bacterium]|nr:hypothetical protein [Bacteroidota bacterium]